MEPTIFVTSDEVLADKELCASLEATGFEIKKANGYMLGQYSINYSGHRVNGGPLQITEFSVWQLCYNGEDRCVIRDAKRNKDGKWPERFFLRGG